MLAALSSLAFSASVGAQMVVAPLGVGVDQRVRVTAPTLFTGKAKGSVVSPVADTLFLKERSGVRTIPVSAMTQIDVSHGRNRLLWGFLGATAGFFAGGLIGGNMYDTGESDIDGILGVIGGAALGTVGGAIVGAIAAPERWKRLPTR